MSYFALLSSCFHPLRLSSHFFNRRRNNNGTYVDVYVFVFKFYRVSCARRRAYYSFPIVLVDAVTAGEKNAAENWEEGVTVC